MKSQTLNSALYECTVLHERFAPRSHRFSYRLFYLAMDLDELDTLHRSLAFLSVNARNLLSFREADYLPTDEPLHRPSHPATPGDRHAPTSALKARVRAFCTRHGADFGEDGRVLLVTLPRVLGYLFNPVSFYFCHDASGRAVGAIAEVTNTFHEVKAFFIPPARPPHDTGTLHLRVPKHFYVSPFSPLDLEFDFTLRPPGGKLAVRIDDHAAGRRVLHTTLTGIRKPNTNLTHAWFLLKYPLLTLGVVARIHWQALRLWLKRVPFFPKAAGAADQRDLYRPHSSLNQTPPA